MARYYINGYNTIDTAEFPYTSVGGGAPNFTILLENLNSVLEDGDIIYVDDGEKIDNSDQDINIYHDIYIMTNPKKNIPIYVKDDGFGFNIYSDGVQLLYTTIVKANYRGNPMLNVYGNNMIVRNSNFRFDESSSNGAMISLNECQKFYMSSSNSVMCPLGDDSSFGIYAKNSSYCTIRDTQISMLGGHGRAISFIGECNHNNIVYNTTYGVGVISASTDNVGVFFDVYGNYNNINHNAIVVDGSSSTGIYYNVNSVGGVGVEIQNNNISIYENDYSSVGVHVPYSEDNTVSDFIIINNNIEYRNNITSASNDSIAINASILRGVIDFNNIFGFDTSNKFVHTGDNVINSLGSKCIDVEPRTMYHVGDPDQFPLYDIRRYYVDQFSQCIGAGHLQHNIGVGVYTKSSMMSDHYLNLIDTVTNGFGDVPNTSSSYTITNTFFNSVFSEDVQSFNIYYRGGAATYTSATNVGDTYPSDVYQNQFDHKLTINFPFTKEDHLYNKDYTYVLTNKRDLKPFRNIECPSQGYGYNTVIQYKGYENGLWGYPRVSYSKNCLPDPCIVQDSYTHRTIREDIYHDVVYVSWLIDSIDPECFGDSTDSAPWITVLGDNPLTVYVGDIYTDKGATAYDIEDGNITSKIITYNDVDVNVVGSYSVTYKVTDVSNNTTTAMRVVNVVNAI